MAAQQFEEFLSSLDKRFAGNPVVKPLQDATKQRPAFVVLGLAGFVSLIIVYIFGLELLSDLFGMIPIYASLKSLSKKEVQENIQWVTYWILFATLDTAEGLFDNLYDTDEEDDGFFEDIFELVYYFAKIGFLLWAGSPHFRGAEQIYSRAIAPVFDKVDAVVSKKE